MRAMPNMTVFAPADPVEARLVAAALPAIPGPVYVRLSKAGDPVLHDGEPDFAVGRALRLREGDDVTLISTGTSLALSLEVHAQLKAQGVAAAVLSMPTVAPIDVNALQAAATGGRLLATIEEHGPVGGLHAAVQEALSPEPVRCMRFSLGENPACVAGSASYLSAEAGLLADRIAERVLAAL